ncbi:MAG TPA: DUF3426 domain-containing protein [Syntrophales bacterium]|nr:DUF3426 domain-containing protein [Syntrophales bacterium]
MIIQCGKCSTKFRFDETKMEGEGAWVRCGRCRNVFFQENPGQDAGIAPGEKDDPEVPAWDAGQPPAEDPAEAAEQNYEDDILAERPPKRAGKGLWTPGKITAYVGILVFVMAGVYLWLFPDIRSQLLNAASPWIPFSKQLGMEATTAEPPGGGIDLLDVRERFIENRIMGNIMVIQGMAVNKNKTTVSRIRVRAKLIDSAGEFVAEADTYCGNLLSDDELANLTEKEVRAELGSPDGRSIPNSGIGPEATIPFMAVFINPPRKAVEFIVELGSLER